MKLISQLTAKFAKLFMGKLVADLGTLDIDEHGRQMSFSIRRRPGEPVHIQGSYVGGDIFYFEITRTKEWADQFERVAQEIRKHL